MKQNQEEMLRQAAESRRYLVEQGLVPPTPFEASRDLQSDDPKVRKFAARALWTMGAKGKEAIPALIEVLDDENPEVRGFAVRALWKMEVDGAEVIPVLIDALDDEQSLVRGYAARILGQMGAEAKGAVPLLTEMLSDQTTYSVPVMVLEPAIEFFTGRQIGRGGSYREEGTHTVYVRANAAEALARIGPATEGTVSALTGLLGDEQPSVRGSAAQALGRIGPEDMPTIRALTLRLHDEADYYPEADAPSLSGTYRTIEGFDSKAVHVCDTAAEILAQIGAETTLPALQDLLVDKDAKLRRGAAKGLALLGVEAKTATPDLIAALQDKSWQVRLIATEALGVIGPEAKVAAGDLVGLLLEEDRESGHTAPVERMRRALDLRQAVAEALRKMMPDAAANLTEMLQHEDNRVQSTTAFVVGEIGPEAKATIPDLTELLQDKDHKVRIAAVWALGKMGTDAKDTIPDLKNLLEGENEQIRQSAAEALKAIGEIDD
jgi:HEAT repeat protein